MRKYKLILLLIITCILFICSSEAQIKDSTFEAHHKSIKNGENISCRTLLSTFDSYSLESQSGYINPYAYDRSGNYGSSSLREHQLNSDPVLYKVTKANEYRGKIILSYNDEGRPKALWIIKNIVNGTRINLKNLKIDSGNYCFKYLEVNYKEIGEKIYINFSTAKVIAETKYIFIKPDEILSVKLIETDKESKIDIIILFSPNK